MANEQCRLRIIVYHPQRRCRPAGLKFGSDLIHRIESCFAALLCHWRKEKTRQQQIGGISVRDALRIGEATSLIADIVGTTNKRAAAMIFPVTQLISDLKATTFHTSADLKADVSGQTVSLCVITCGLR